MLHPSPVDWPASALSRAIHARALSCREVMSAFLAQIDRLNPTHNAIVSRVDPDQLLTQADQRDRQLDAGHSLGWMHGFPMAIKDLSPTAGILTTFGSPLLARNVPQADSILVERMKAAGGIVIGKTNTPEFGLGSHTYNPVFGATRNAWDPALSAGGSSGGAAVALALRMLPVADGSDMMGSLRNPAGFNHVFGLRPSQGLVPHGPLDEQFVSQLGTEGPMARNVDDLAQLLAVQAGRDSRAPLSVAGRWPGETMDLARNTGALRIGWLGDLEGYLAIEPGILSVCESALGRFAGDGCDVESIAFGYDPVRAWNTWITLRAWMVAGKLSAFSTGDAQRSQIKPEALWEIAQGEGLLAARVFAACAERTALYQHMRRLLERYDVLALPVAQVWPFPVEQHWPREVAGRAMDTYHRWMEVVIYATLAGLPAISVPAGFGANGLPMGLQLIGRPQADLALLRIAHRYERLASDLLSRKPANV
ncbi:amidase [Variovorax sp. PAMC 28711]|uniref:amidase n=1 Tax=Variovorax sp. PAMC 28711 TaxID=1795631 RepID=UPI00078EDD0E|nr:amidase [Variovorax sp. PAMC 28711]AMM25961.1 amidase [Variovorax sp. PAMC 28711]